MKVTKSTPIQTMKIAGHNFAIAAPFAEGHALTANEASAMNQLLAENVRNNFAKRVKDAGDSPNLDELQSQLDEYVKGYEFGVRRAGGGRSGDPIEAEAMEISRNRVKEAIKAKGLKIADFTAAKITELAAGYLEKNPQVRDLAQTVVEQRKQAAEAVLEGI